MRAIIYIVLIVKITVAASDATCGVVPITQWSGSPLKREEILPGPVNIVIIQHTATPECADDEKCERIASAIRDDHRLRGFTDIGNSFLIGGTGKVYEGAGWKYVGAHTHVGTIGGPLELLLLAILEIVCHHRWL
ncbi:unnamed protein product [Arctia plantaginis]|uniref:Peptidoglycan recognition protein family domain-containing protein n=1 Tax=Arctia plantaginis TaxID=874455 RepID=A0A8S1A484_ARCPL|nr:unnamed protein product [Arctia plantaginis]